MKSMTWNYDNPPKDILNYRKMFLIKQILNISFLSKRS